MPKRIVLLLALLGLGLTAGAVAPWTVSWPSLSSGVEQQVQRSFGLHLAVTGRSTLAFLPVPRVKFDGITVSTADGTPLITGGQLRGKFRIWPLLWGEFRLVDLSLTGSRVNFPVDAGGGTPWDAVVHHVRDRLAAGSTRGHLRRLLLTDSTLVIAETATGRQSLIDDVDLVASWPKPDGVLEMEGSLRWRGETTTFALADVVPAALFAGRPSRVTLRAASGLAQLQVSGDVTPAAKARFAGRASFETRSLREFGRWAGMTLPLGPLLGPASAEGPLTAEGRAASWSLSWPSLRLKLGPDSLDGALLASVENGRLGVTGTLAADSLTLPEAFAPLGPGRAGAGWSPDALDFAALTGADLDLRLSAAAARIGGLRLADLAGGIVVKPGRVEASLGRASLGGGRIKGRMSLNTAGSAVEFRLNGGFERVEAGAVLADLGQMRWLAGLATGQATVEAVGESPSDMVRQATGRGTLTVRNGEIGGVNLADLLRRAESRPLSAFLDWRGGRTPFEQVQGGWTMSGGIAEVEGAVTSPALRSRVQGRVSLIERSVGLRATVEGAAGRGASTVVFDLNGPWDDVAVVPDALALIERSGAARPLLPASTQ